MVQEQVDVLEPRIEQVLHRFRVPPEEAQAILDEIMLAMLTKRDRIRNPERWLLRTLKNRCLLYWQERRRRLYRVIDSGVVSILSSRDVPREEKRALQREVGSLLDGLSPDCRRYLEVRYGLGSPPALPKLEPRHPTGSERDELLRCIGALARRFTRAIPLEDLEDLSLFPDDED